MLHRTSLLLSNKTLTKSKRRSYASQGYFKVPRAVNAPIKDYLPGSPERIEVEETIKQMRSTQLEVPLVINGEEVFTGDVMEMRVPHDHSHVLGVCHQAREQDVKKAIESSLEAHQQWSRTDVDDRLAILLRVGELLDGPFRQKLNASTILGQSKNYYQAEIDAACEAIDFCRFNAELIQKIVADQPLSSSSIWNKSSYRALEGFVYAVTPFNFTSIAMNLCLSPAMMGNVILWKPSAYATYSGHYLMQLFKEAGLPDGVVNFVPGNPEMVTDIALQNENFAGLHFTGSTKVFKDLWKKIGNNLDNYKSYPRIVGETGGKDFIFAHNSADIPSLVTALIRGSFEFGGQKCSASSRAFIPSSIWGDVKASLLQNLKNVKHGNPENPEVLVNAVIHEASFDKTVSYIELAKNSDDCEIISGGGYDKSTGYFIEPTVVVTTNPRHRLMTEEIFAPVLTIHIYEDEEFIPALRICDTATQYALTGAFFAKDRYAIIEASKELEHSAGNFYINDKPTGAVVGQQPFGGSRGSGTNDKAGSYLNLTRWTSVRSIKETFVPPTDWKYPYMKN